MKHHQFVFKIKRFIKTHKLTNEQFCKICSIKTEILYKIFNKEHYVSIHELKNIADVLGLELIDTLTY